MHRNVLTKAMLVWGAMTATSAAKDVAIVRLEAKGENGRVLVLSTGTHIGNGLILTCAHCCKASGGRGAKAVAHIPSSKTLVVQRTVPVTVMCYDRDADVGLMVCDDKEAIDTSYELAPRGYELRAGSRVHIYGWNGGGKAETLFSAEQKITRVNPYMGAANIEITGVPRQGMSGGPLVTADDLLIVGVAVAADPMNNRGIYCGLEPIYKLLEHHAKHPFEIRTTAGQK